MVAIEWITRILLNFVNSLDMRCTCGYYQQRCSNDGVWYIGHWLFVSGAVDVSILPALWCMSNFNFSNTSAQLKFYRMSFEGRFTSLIGVARGGTNTRVDRLLPSPILIYSNNSKPSFACHIISRDPTSPTFSTRSFLDSGYASQGRSKIQFRCIGALQRCQWYDYVSTMYQVQFYTWRINSSSSEAKTKPTLSAAYLSKVP